MWNQIVVSWYYNKKGYFPVINVVVYTLKHKCTQGPGHEMEQLQRPVSERNLALLS